jgi:FtsH-binding integral membrane protein
MSTRPPDPLESRYSDPEALSRTVARAGRDVFAQTMFLVAATLGFAALGAWVARDISGGWAIAAWIGAIVLLIGLNVVRKRRASGLAMTMLFGFGTLLGVAVAPTLAAYASMEGGPALIAQAAGLTALFVAGFGAWGYATKRDLAVAARFAFFALLALIVAAIVAIFVTIPAFNLIWSIAGLAIFAVFTAFDFQRLRRAGEDQVVMLAASIFLDVFNVFLFFLNILGGGSR